MNADVEWLGDVHRLGPQGPHHSMRGLCRGCGEPWPCNVAQLLEDHAALAARAERAEIALAKLYEYTKRVEAQYAPMLASRSYLPGFPDGAEELGDEIRAVLAPAAPRAAGEGE